MNHAQSVLPIGSLARSMGVKLMVICGLAVLMTIPAIFVSALVDDRSRRATDVADEISSHVGGPQTFLGPTLVIPYSIPERLATQPAMHGTYLVFPTKAVASVQTATTERHRSLFRVPVFRADLKLDATFDLKGVPASAPQGARLDWDRAEIVVGVSDPRGALADGTLAIEGKNVNLVPAEVASEISFQPKEQGPNHLVLLGAKSFHLARPEASFRATASLQFSGAKRLALLSYGKTTQMTARGDWQNPGFDGAILPTVRNVSSAGFSAEWSVPFIARGVRAEGPIESMAELNNTALGISFIEIADAYQSVSRSLKYALLFVGLVFLSYFVFEISTGKRVHPAQYILVGVAQIVFYLLLLSIAERIGFDFGFLLAATATVTLLSVNAGWIFSARKQMVRAFLIFSVLYALIYLLLRLEDNALLVGAICSLLAVATVMYLSRELDWYSARLSPRKEEHPSGNAV